MNVSLENVRNIAMRTAFFFLTESSKCGAPTSCAELAAALHRAERKNHPFDLDNR
jgi:hypothetical protein